MTDLKMVGVVGRETPYCREKHKKCVIKTSLSTQTTLSSRVCLAPHLTLNLDSDPFPQTSGTSFFVCDSFPPALELFHINTDVLSSNLQCLAK